MTQKTRIDIALVEGGHFESRAKAREAVEAGLVRVDGEAAGPRHAGSFRR